MEIIIDGQVYNFVFGMGFLREINKKFKTPVDGMKGVDKEIGLQYRVAGLMDGDIEDLIDILAVANRTETPRVTHDKLDKYIDEECDDIDALFSEVLDELKKSNATKTKVLKMETAIEAEMSRRGM